MVGVVHTDSRVICNATPFPGAWSWICNPPLEGCPSDDVMSGQASQPQASTGLLWQGWPTMHKHEPHCGVSAHCFKPRKLDTVRAALLALSAMACFDPEIGFLAQSMPWDGRQQTASHKAGLGCRDTKSRPQSNLRSYAPRTSSEPRTLAVSVVAVPLEPSKSHCVIRTSRDISQGSNRASSPPFALSSKRGWLPRLARG